MHNTSAGHTHESSVALPSTQNGLPAPVDIFEVSKAGPIDAGCPKDLARPPCDESPLDSIYDSSIHTFETVAGDVESDAKILFESDVMYGQMIARVLVHAPPVLTVGE